MTAPSTFTYPNTESIARHDLPNGITVLVYENQHTETVVLSGSLRVGSIYETPAQSGLASITAEALLHGTKNRDFDAIGNTLENIGADLNVGGGKFRSSFGGKSLAEDLPTLVEMLADVLRNPVFPEDEIERIRAQRLTELNYAQQNTRYLAGRMFREALYPDNHPYHYSSYGSLETLPNVTQEALQNFHTTHYGPQDMIIVVVGAVQAEAVIALVDEKLGDWDNPRQPAEPVLPVVSAPQKIIRAEKFVVGKTQSDLVMATLGPTRDADDYLAATLANSILGEFGMMGRIGNIIREQLGLAYYAYSRIEGGQGPGAWHVTAGVAPQNIELAIEKAQDQLRRIITEPVSEQDLADNQSYFVGRLPLRLERNAGIASIIHAMERYDLGLDYLVRYRDIIFGFTRDDLLRATQRYLNPDALVIAVAGPEYH